MKKFLSLILVAIMLVTAVPLSVMAASEEYDFWSALNLSESQCVIKVYLNGNKFAEGVWVYDFENENFYYEENYTDDIYYMVPRDSQAQMAGSEVEMPKILANGYTIGWNYGYTFPAESDYIFGDAVYTEGMGTTIYMPRGVKKLIINASPVLYKIINYKDGMPTAGENLTWTFDETTGTLTISGNGPMYDFDTFPDSSKSYYKIPWEDFGEEIKHVVIGDGVTSIGNNAFKLCYNLIDVSISDSVVSIGDNAFEYCLSLSDFTMSDSITTIGEMTFYNCLSLKSVKLPKNISYIGSGAFGNLLFLEEFTIESKTVDIGELAFGVNEYSVVDMSCEDFVDLYIEIIKTSDSDLIKIFNSHVIPDDIKCYADVRAHEGSSTETYIEGLKELYKEAGLECDISFIPTHFFEGEWIYDAENQYCYRKCIHCDEREISEDIGDIEIEAPVNPDTDFTVDVVEDYVIIEETISNNVTTDFEIIKAFDISLKNKDGVHVQPNGTVKVKLPNDWSKNGVYKVYHVNDDGTLTDMNAYREGSHLVFETDHFSIYVIVVENEETEPDEPIVPDEPDEPVVPDTPEEPTEPEESECGCLCHKRGGVLGLLSIIFEVIIRSFNLMPTCSCGVAHY